MPDFLLEIGCEEIPARMIAGASLELQTRVRDLLTRERLAASSEISHLETPRRLAVLAAGIPAAQPDITEQITGPSVSVAFKDGQPTPAAHAFAKKARVDVSRLERVTTPKGEYLAATVTRKGRPAPDVLSELLPKEINSIYWPKNMYWRKRSELFVRPVRWLVAMLDGEVIPLEFDGVRAGNESRGHRILAAGPVKITRAGTDYVDALRQAKVLGQQDREKQIRKALDAATRTVPGARWREDKSLLDTVVNLTEFPSAILGSFDREFLELPDEVLVTVMRDHQKYFAVEDASGKLLPHFLAVLNTDGDHGGIIRHGNERVLRARFNDARFFWKTDQKHPLRERTEWLKNVTFQKDLGSYHAKTMRVQRLCSWICEVVRDGGIAVRPGVVHKAACLAKTDLTTELVKEFTELQGIVGGLYARVQQLDDDLPEATRFAIADVIYDQYKPESMEDSVPRTVEGAVLSVADKADTIAGMFALGLLPTGSKDPFALRRQANGIVKTIAEHKLPVSLDLLFVWAKETYKNSDAEKKFNAKLNFTGSIQEFFRERLEFYLREQGYAYDVVKAVLSTEDLSQVLYERENLDFSGFDIPISVTDRRRMQSSDISDDVVGAIQRVAAIAARKENPDFRSVLVAFKRTRNILVQAIDKGYSIGPCIPITTEDEIEAHKAVLEAGKGFSVCLAEHKYSEALDLMVKLRPQIDSYFDHVLVMADREVVRRIRLGFLADLYRTFRTIADFSEIVTDGKG